MTEVTPEQQALYALARDLPRSDLPMAAQLEYDRLMPAWERGELTDWVPPRDLEPALLQHAQDAVKQRASHVVRHTVDKSGTTHTFRFHRGRHVVLAIICAVFGASFLAAAVAFGLFDFAQTGLLWEIGFVGAGLFFVWGAICSFRSGVKISGDKLTIVNELWMHVIDASSIRAITLKPHARTNENDRWRPRVEQTSGRGVWIENFNCGPASRPPRPELVAVVEQVRALLGVSADDPGQPAVRERA